MRKTISWILTIAMVLTLCVAMPMTASAADATERYVYDAETLPDGSIGVLFIYGGTSASGIVTGGTLYFGNYNPDTAEWVQAPVTPGGNTVAAKDAAMALDAGGNPHVAYIFNNSATSKDNIGYTYWNNGAWSAANVVTSSAPDSGTLYCPDLVIGSDGIVYLNYADTHGSGSQAYSNYVDLMYATVENTVISTSVVVTDQYWASGSDYYMTIPLRPSKIALSSGVPVVGYGLRARSGDSSSWSSSFGLKTAPAFSGSAITFASYVKSTAADYGFVLHQMDSYNSNVYSLFSISKNSADAGLNSGLNVVKGTGVPAIYNVAGIQTAAAMTVVGVNDTDVYVAGMNGTTLTMIQGAAPTTATLTTAINTAHPRMATVVSGSTQYIFYTGADTEKSLFIASTPISGGAVNEYRVPNKTPVTITGVTVASKEYDGETVTPGGTLSVIGAAMTTEDLTYTYTSTDGGGYSSSTPPADAGSYRLVISIPEDNANYFGGSGDIAFNITQKALTVTGITATNRVYTVGDTSVELETAASVLSGVIDADTDKVTLDATGATGAMADANAGNGKNVIVTGCTISGTSAGNYNLTQPMGITVDITPLTLNAPTVALSADVAHGGLSATVSDGANIAGIGSYTVEIYLEANLKKTINGAEKGTVCNIPLEDSAIVAEESYIAKAKAVADASGNYADSGLGGASASAVAVYAPLAFTDNTAYDIPASRVDIPISSIDISNGVTGGKAPYTFSALGLPDWVEISQSGIITGTPAAVAGGGTATVTVTDAQATEQSFDVAFGAVGKGIALDFEGTAPPAVKTYGDVTFSLGLTYDGSAENVSYSILSGSGTLNEKTLTINGAGNIVIRTIGISDNYETKIQDYTIAVSRKSVTITPTANNNTKVYGQNDSALTYTNTELIGADSLSGAILARVSGENAGSYAISIAADAGVNNPNYTLSVAPGNHYFTITQKQVTVTSAIVSSKAFDTTTAIDVSAVTNITLDGDLDNMILGTDFEVNSASYTDDAYAGIDKSTSITIVLKNTVKANNYKFDGGAETYSGATAGIAPAVQTIAATDQTLTVTHTLDLTAIASSNVSGAALSFAIEGGASESATLSGALLTGTSPGTVTININSAAINVGGTADTEYNVAAQRQITVTVSAKENGDDTITFNNDTITYGGSYAPNAITSLTDGEWNYSYSGTALDGTPYSSDKAPTKTGGYTVTAIYENPTHIGTRTMQLTIIAKAITITGVTAMDRAYDGTTTVDVNGGVLQGVEPGDDISPSVPAIGTTANANAGNSKAVTLSAITLTGADKDNYTLTQPTGITVNILSKVTTFAVDFIPAADYSGSQIAPEVTVKEGSTTPIKNTDYIVSYGNNIGAGTAAGTVTITGIGNYAGSSANAVFTINKADYSGTAISGIKQVIAGMAVTGVTVDLAAISYPVGFTNMSFAFAGIASDPDGLITGTALVADDILTFDITGKPAGTNAILQVTVNSDNYNDYLVAVTIATVDKTVATITGVTVANKVYDGTHAAPGGIPANNDGYIGTYTYLYEGTGTTAYPSSTTPPVNAGTYMLTVKIPDSDPTYMGQQVLHFTINKAALTVKPKNTSIFTNDTVPTPDIEYVGLLNGDTGTTAAVLSSGTLEMEIKDTDRSTGLTSSATSGTYTIQFIGSPIFQDTGNYTISITEGTLTISNRPTGGVGVPNTSGVAGDRDENTAFEIKTEDGSKIVTAVLTKTDNGVRADLAPDKLGDLAGTDQGVIIDTGDVVVTFDAIAIDYINNASGTEGITLTIEQADAPSLTQETLNMIGNRPVYDFRLSAGGNTISSFGNGHATISIPYTLQPGENAHAIVVYYLTADGSLNIVRGRYDALTGTVIFRATHFSRFVIGYNAMSFGDISSDIWYEDAVSFIAARGITTGVGDNLFAPDLNLTRGQFIVMLMKAFDIGVESAENYGHIEQFDDAGSTYYTDYLLLAKALKITNGVGNNLFAPEKEITRQEMFAMLYNALTIFGEQPGSALDKQLTDFSDASQVDAWAVESLSALIASGVVEGNDGMINPLAFTTRAQMAQVLYNLLSK